MKRLTFKRPWWDPRDEFVIAMNLALGTLVFAAPSKFGAFIAGVNAGYGVYCWINYGATKRREFWRKQTLTDLQTLGDIVERFDGYKLSHHREKAMFN